MLAAIGVVNINRGIFPETASHHCFFVLSMVSLSFVLRRSRAGYSEAGSDCHGVRTLLLALAYEMDFKAKRTLL